MTACFRAGFGRFTVLCGILMSAALLATAASAPAGATTAPWNDAARARIDQRLAAAHFAEPLVATGPTMQAEDEMLRRAVDAYERRGSPDDFFVGARNGRFEVRDPTFGRQGMWMTQATQAALDAEASGYFLAQTTAAQTAGWRQVDAEEAGRVWGAGPTNGPDPNDPGPPADPPPDDCPLCTYNVSKLAVGLSLTDRPVGYSPPKGPSAKVTITYNQREASQPANFNFFNIIPKWTPNWLTYIQDDPAAPGTNVTRYRPDGGASVYSGYNPASGAFTPEEKDASVLSLVSKTKACRIGGSPSRRLHPPCCSLLYPKRGPAVENRPRPFPRFRRVRDSDTRLQRSDKSPRFRLMRLLLSGLGLSGKAQYPCSAPWREPFSDA